MNYAELSESERNVRKHLRALVYGCLHEFALTTCPACNSEARYAQDSALEWLAAQVLEIPQPDPSVYEPLTVHEHEAIVLYNRKFNAARQDRARALASIVARLIQAAHKIDKPE